MTLPIAFGSSWEQFIDVWCHGSAPPSFGRETIEQGLSALQRLWPEEVTRITSPLRPNLGIARGKAVIIQAVSTGLVLLRCEAVMGFNDVLEQMKSDPAQAYRHYSTFLFAVLLIEAGYPPVLEPQRGNKKPDARIVSEVGDVYFEVITPDPSDAMKTTWSDLRDLASKLAAENTGRRVSVFLHRDLDEPLMERIVEFVKGTACADQPFELGTDARISVRSMSQDDLLVVPGGNADPAILNAACAMSNSHATAAIPKADQRVKRFLNNESDHFSRDHMNVLAANLSCVPGGMKTWTQLLPKCLQQHRRFGAAVLFSELSMARQVQCQCIRNTAAYKPVPQTLTDWLAGTWSVIDSSA
jgi:hypothetical protein